MKKRPTIYLSRVTHGEINSADHYDFRTDLKGVRGENKFINSDQDDGGKRDIINWFKAKLLHIADTAKTPDVVILFSQEFRVEVYHRELFVPMTRGEIDMFFEAVREFRDKY